MYKRQVLVTAVADGGPDGRRVRQRLRGGELGGPGLVYIEVLSALRRHVRHGHLTEPQADTAVADLLDLPLHVFPTERLMRQCWQLRYNITPYDACYVALAAALDCVLLTADSKLARAAETICKIETMTAS